MKLINWADIKKEAIESYFGTEDIRYLEEWKNVPEVNIPSYLKDSDKPEEITISDIYGVLDEIVKIIKQRLKEACEFYLRYKDKPECLWEEKPEYRKVLKEMFVFHKENGEPYFSEGDFGWEIYNKWLFKLAFESVLDGENKK